MEHYNNRAILGIIVCGVDTLNSDSLVCIEEESEVKLFLFIFIFTNMHAYLANALC